MRHGRHRAGRPRPSYLSRVDPSWPASLAPLWGLLVLGHIGLAIAYVRRARRSGVPARGADWVFAGAFAAGCLALLLPASLAPLAAAALESSGLPDALREADARLQAVEEMPPAIWEELSERFGWPFEGPSPLDPIPLRGERTLEERAVPAVQLLLLRWLRAATWAASTGAMMAAFLWRRTASSRSRLARLEERVARLEVRPPPSGEEVQRVSFEGVDSGAWEIAAADPEDPPDSADPRD